MTKQFVKRFLSCVLALSLILALAACGNESKEDKKSESLVDQTKNSHTSSSKAEDETAEREHVELVMYNYTSREYSGQKETIEAVNKYLKEKLNTTIDMHVMVQSEYSSKVGTILSSGSDVDIVFTRDSVLPFVTYVGMNAFLPLEDYVDEYLPGTKGIVAENSWKAVTVDGHLYAVPVPRDSAMRFNMWWNATMLEDLGLTAPEDYHTFYDVVDFLYEAKAARDKKYPEKANQPIMRGFLDLLFGYYNVDRILSQSDLVYSNVPGLTGFEGMGEGETVFCPYMTQDYVEWCKLRRQLVKDNIIPFDTKSFDPDKVLFKAGEFLADCSLGEVTLSEDVNLPYFKTQFVPAKDAVLTTGGFQHGFAISSSSKNVERCLEVIELFNTDSYLATVLRFGPEGIGWTDKDNDGIIEYGAVNDVAAGERYMDEWYGWHWGGLSVSKTPPSVDGNFGELLTQMNNEATTSANIGFIFDVEPVKNEIAACVNVVSEYHGVLKLGQNDNVDQLIDEFVKKLKDNGVEKIVEEAQSQLDTWRAANK